MQGVIIEAMTTIQNILFPVDFSPSCVAMAANVKRAAAMFGAKVTLVHVFDLYSHDAFQLYVRPLSEVAEEQRNLARSRLDSFLKSEFPHAETISPRQLEHREWVCAIGLHSDSQRVLRYASQAAKSVHANLTLVHVIPANGSDLPVELDLEERLQLAKREVASVRIEALQSVAGSRAPVSIAVGPIRDMLTEAARRLRADVLVIGRCPLSGVLGRLRDLSYAIARDAPCPVLSV